MATQEARDDDALERSAAYDELLRSLGGPATVEAGAAVSEVGDVPTAGIIRLLHEVFRTPRADVVTSDEPLPERVGRFIIHRLLGRGAFGSVYLAHDPILRREVALKVFHQHLLADESTRRHVLREREIMAHLQHPNIVPVWEAGEIDDLLYIASEYCPGPTLAEWLVDREQRATEFGRAAVFSPVSLRQCASWIYRLADAVQHSHERGVVHRDLKPGNVLLEPQGDLQSGRVPSDWRPRLTDFGLAKYFHAVQDETRSGLFVGSLEYASPEQVRGRPDAVGPASDIYSLGVLLYELLTDEMPHKADSDYDLARKICEQDVVFSAEHRRALPRDLQAITLRALEREPRNRYASAADMRDDLQRFLAGEFVTARPVSIVERTIRCARKNPDVAFLSGLCICFALLLVGTLFHSNQQLADQSAELKQALEEVQKQNREAQTQRATANVMQQRAEQSERQARKVGYLANMRLAYEAWEENNLVDVRELLERAASQAPSLRGTDWYLLHRELAARYKTLPRMDEAVYALAYQPSEGSLLTVNESGKVRRWDLQSETQTDEFQANVGVHAVAIAPDAKTLAIGQQVGPKFGASTLALWDLEHRKQAKDARHYHSTTIESIEYSPDGKWLASGPRYQPVIVTNLENGDSFAIASERRNNQLAFSPTSDRLAVNTAKSKIEIYDLATHKRVLEIATDIPRIASHAWLPSRELIAVNSFAGAVRLYSTRSGELVATLPTPYIAESLTASPDGRLLALGTCEGRLQVFDLTRLSLSDEATAQDLDKTADKTSDKEAGENAARGAKPAAISTPLLHPPASPQILSGFVTDVEFVGRWQVAASDEEGNLACLDLAAHAYRRFRRKEAFWTSMHWESEDSLTIFSNKRPPEQRSLQGNANTGALFSVPEPVNMVVSADGKLQAVYTQSGELAVTDLESGKDRFLVRSDPGNATDDGEFVTLAAVISKNNEFVFTTGENNRLTAWKVADGSIAWEELLTNTGRTIVEDPATGRLFVGGNFETLRVYDSQSGRLLDDRTGGNGTASLVIDSAGGRLISGHFDGTLRICDLALSRQATIHRSHGNMLTALTLSPDARAIISGDADGIVRVWNADGEPLGAIHRSRLPGAKVQKFLWSPSGAELAILITGHNGVSEVLCWKAAAE